MVQRTVTEGLLPAAVVVGVDGGLEVVGVMELCGELLVRSTAAPLDLGRVVVVVGLDGVGAVVVG